LLRGKLGFSCRKLPCASANPSLIDMKRFLQLSKTDLVSLTVFVLLLTGLPLNDPDYFWHLKTGETIVTHRALPHGDVFSFTRAGQPWVLHEWLFEVLLYGVHSLSGALGVRALVATLAIAAPLLTFMTARRLAGAGAAWLPMAIGAMVFAGGVAPRPQLLTYVFFAFYLSALLRFKYGRETRALFVLPFVMVVWVNAHAAYAVGIALVVLFAACEWIGWAFQPVRDPGQKRRLLRLTQVAGLVVLASLANPGLFERWLYPFQVIGMSTNALIQEWQSPDFHLLGPSLYLALLLLFLVSCTYARRKPDLTELALPLCFAVQGMLALRHMPLAAMVLVPFAALALERGPLAALQAGVRNLQPVRWYMARRGAGRDLAAGEFVLNWLVACTVLVLAPLYFRSRQPDAGVQRGPVLARGAADFVAAHGLHGNLFNQYGDGGYLIYRLAPRVKVAIDGRADMYGDRFIQAYLQVYQGAAGWQASFERLPVDLALLPLDAPIRQLLLASERFREVYRDTHYSVLQRDAAPGLITRYEVARSAGGLDDATE
jgi:hypothetical protein